MKILDRKSFLEVPVGTLFMKVRACDVGPLQMFRGRAGPNDFIYRDMIEVDSESSDEFATILTDACEHKTRDEIPLDWWLDMSRDGLYDDDQMFGVLTPEECGHLQSMLTEAETVEAVSEPPPPIGPIAELVAMLSVAANEEGVTVFDHTPEEIGLHVMENHKAFLAFLATQPATSQEGEACEHEAYAVDTVGQPTRCVDCGASMSALAATPTPPTLSEDLREAVQWIVDNPHSHPANMVAVARAATDRAQVKACADSAAMASDRR